MCGQLADNRPTNNFVIIGNIIPGCAVAAVEVDAAYPLGKLCGPMRNSVLAGTTTSNTRVRAGSFVRRRELGNN